MAQRSSINFSDHSIPPQNSFPRRNQSNDRGTPIIPPMDFASSPYRENSHSFSVPSTSRRDQAAQPLVDLSIDVNKLRTDRNRLRNDVEEQKKSLEILKTATRNEKKYADDQIQIAQKASTDITKFKNQIEELLIESTALTNKISTDTAQLESLKSETTKIKEDKRNQSDALQWFLDEIELKKTELNELHKQKDDMQINTRIQQIQHDVYVRVKSMYKSQEAINEDQKQINDMICEEVKRENKEEAGSSQRKRTRVRISN